MQEAPLFRLRTLSVITEQSSWLITVYAHLSKLTGSKYIAEPTSARYCNQECIQWNQLLEKRGFRMLKFEEIKALSKKKSPWPESASELYRPSDRRLSAKIVPTFADRGCHVVSVTDPYGRILDFLDRNRYLFFQVAPQLYSRGWVDSVPDPLLLRKSGSAGNRTRDSGSVARNSDH
jgi:hypothetical protein